MNDRTSGEEGGGRKAVRVEYNIPVPPPNKKWPWDTMDVGGSFFAPMKGERVKFIRQMRVQAARAGRKYERTFQTRVTRNGMRIWRKA